MDTIILLGVLIVGTIGLATIFGIYLTRMITFEMRPLEKPLSRIEGGLYRVMRIDAPKQIKKWKEYFHALFMNNFTNNQSLASIIIKQSNNPFLIY